MSEVTYRWVDGPTADEREWAVIDSLLAARGWMSLARMTTRLLLAEQDDRIVGFSVLQFLPTLGPLFVRPEQRGTGIAESLADKTIEFMIEAQARGWIVIAESPFAKKLCEDRGMGVLPYPVYVSPGGAPSEDS